MSTAAQAQARAAVYAPPIHDRLGSSTGRAAPTFGCVWAVQVRIPAEAQPSTVAALPQSRGRVLPLIGSQQSIQLPWTAHQRAPHPPPRVWRSLSLQARRVWFGCTRKEHGTPMTFIFEPAIRAQCKARIVLEGPAGSGKTYTALTTAAALAGEGKIAVIDTQNRYSLHYADLWTFDVLHMNSFHPKALVEALAAASAYDVCIIDSWSSFWEGQDGMLDQVNDKTSGSERGGAFTTGWKEMRPAERNMLESMQAYTGHLIATLRVKTDYVLETNPATGKVGPRAVGMKPIQRDGIDYEFETVATMDLDHTLVVRKTSNSDMDGRVVHKPGPELGHEMLLWLTSGQRTKTAWDFRAEALEDAHTRETLKELWRAARAAGRLATPMNDENGDPSTLGDIILRRGRELPTEQKGTAS